MKEQGQHIIDQIQDTRFKNQELQQEILDSRIRSQEMKCISFIKNMELKEVRDNCLDAIQFNSLTVIQFTSFKIEFDNSILQRKDVNYKEIYLNQFR